MSEQKLDLILSELKKVSEQVTEVNERVTEVNERVTAVSERVTKIETEQQRHGEHIQQLIQIVGATNHNLKEFQQETTKRFDWMDRHMRLLESDFDLILQKSNKHERDINRLKHVE